MSSSPQKAPRIEPAQPKTNSGKAVLAAAEAIRADLEGFAASVKAVADATRELADEDAGIPGMLGACRGLASQLEAVAQAYRERATEICGALTKGPREGVDKIEVNVHPEHAAGASDARR